MGEMTQAVECPFCQRTGVVDAALVTEYRRHLAQNAARRLEALDPETETATYAKTQSEFYTMDSLANQKVAPGLHVCPSCRGEGSLSIEEVMNQPFPSWDRSTKS